MVARPGLPPIERVGCLYAIDPLPQRDNGRVLHVLAVVNDQRGGLQAYVELFSAFRFAVLLTDVYDGPAVSSAYAYDVCSREEIGLDAHQLRGIPWTPEDWDGELLGNAMGPVIEVAIARNQAAWNATPEPERTPDV